MLRNLLFCYARGLICLKFWTSMLCFDSYNLCYSYPVIIFKIDWKLLNPICNHCYIEWLLLRRLLLLPYSPGPRSIVYSTICSIASEFTIKVLKVVMLLQQCNFVAAICCSRVLYRRDWVSCWLQNKQMGKTWMTKQHKNTE